MEWRAPGPAPSFPPRSTLTLEATMRAKSFLHVSLGILALALAYHLGATTATAQAPGNPVVSSVTPGTWNHAVVTANGDVYGAYTLNGQWTFLANVFAGGPTPTTSQESFGSLKVRYLGEREPQSAKPSRTGR
jgi:hypothetical protein